MLDRVKAPATRLWLRVRERPQDADATTVPATAVALETRDRAWNGPAQGLASRRVQFILVVESDRALCQAIVHALEAHGYFVLTARSVREASARFVVQPALLILDTHLSDASGWDLLDWLALCGRELPVVMVTGCPGDTSARQRSRAVLSLVQPCALDTLIAIVQEHVLAPETVYGA